MPDIPLSFVPFKPAGHIHTHTHYYIADVAYLAHIFLEQQTVLSEIFSPRTMCISPYTQVYSRPEIAQDEQINECTSTAYKHSNMYIYVGVDERASEHSIVHPDM